MSLRLRSPSVSNPYCQRPLRAERHRTVLARSSSTLTAGRYAMTYTSLPGKRREHTHTLCRCGDKPTSSKGLNALLKTHCRHQRSIVKYSVYGSRKAVVICACVTAVSLPTLPPTCRKEPDYQGKCHQALISSHLQSI